MRKLALLVLAVLALGLSACSCTLEKKAVSDLRATHKIILPQYVSYVEADAKLTKEQKEDRKKLAESLERLTLSLERSVGD